VTHHTTTQQENTDIKYVFQSYSIKKYILIQFLIQKKLIVVGLFLLLAGNMLNQASFAPRILTQNKYRKQATHTINKTPDTHGHARTARPGTR
jgi:hypothetical protein